MSGVLISYALLAALATGLLIAAFTDLRRREIDNWLTGAIAIGAPLFWLASGTSMLDIGFHVGLALITFLCSPSAPMAQIWGCDLRRIWVSS
jgi:prepilin peptidase CpaA